jgi:hypothetical protein
MVLWQESAPLFDEFGYIVLVIEASAGKGIGLREYRDSGAGWIRIEHGDFDTHSVGSLNHHHAQLTSTKDAHHRRRSIDKQAAHLGRA